MTTSTKLSTVKLFSRPKKVAFIVPESLGDEGLNRIFMHCMNSWGGRYFPIIPAQEFSISDDWMTFLQQSNPDILWVTSKISETLATALAAAVKPARLHIIDNEEEIFNNALLKQVAVDDVMHLRYRGDHEMYCSMLTYSESSEQSSAMETASDNYAIRNFGVLSHSIWRNLRIEQLAFVGGVHIENPVSMFGLFADGIWPIDFCKSGLTSHATDANVFSSEIQVIIGDSIYDSTYAWNRGTLLRVPIPRDTVWVPSEMLNYPQFFAKLGEVIGSWDLFPSTSFEVVSYSESESNLVSAARLLSENSGREFTTRNVAKDSLRVASGRPPRLALNTIWSIRAFLETAD